MGINWQIVGIELVKTVFYVLLSLVSGALVFRKYIAPELTAALQEATKTATMLASLGGIKKADRVTTKELARAVTADLVKTKFPELELVKLAVSPGTWEQIEEALENNPTGVMQLIEEYGHYFKKGADGQEKTKFDF